MTTPDGLLSWAQARGVAATAAHPLSAVGARLDEATGHRLAAALATLQDDPPCDVAAFDGFALRGEGPWVLDADTDVLVAGRAAAVRREDPVPRHVDAVLAADAALVHEHPDGSVTVVAHDALTGLPDELARPAWGEGIVRQAARSTAGTVLAEAGTPVTTALVSLAAVVGRDEIDIVRPPAVGTLVLGSALLERGLPRQGRVRDALGPAVPAFLGALGARAHPAVRAPDTVDLLVREIDDAAVDVIVTTGSTDNHLREVLRDLGARWLVDGVSVTPGAAMLLARLLDGRLIVGLPGDPLAAMAGLVTLASPLVRALRGDVPTDRVRTAVLLEDAPPADYAEDTLLAPVALTVSRAGTQARLLPAGLRGWARAEAIAVVPPGSGVTGDEVEILDPWGRADWPGSP